MRSLILLCTLTAGCLGTETGNPPATPPQIDVSRVELVDQPDGTVRMTGSAGAILPGGGTAGVVNLDGTGALVVVPVDAEGAFDATVESALGGIIRLQGRLDGLRSLPVDFELIALPVPPSPCVTSNPELAHDLGAGPTAVDVALDNACGSEVRVSGTRLLIADPVFTLEAPATPWPIPAGETRTVTVRFDPTGPGEAETVLIIDFELEAAARLAITLWGTGG